MRIGIIGAMEEEVNILKQRMEQQKQYNIHGHKFFTGKIAGKEVVLLRSGIGKVNAAMAATVFNREFPCEYLINVGSAGAINPNLKIGDIVISSELCYHDVDVTAFGYKLGQVPNMPHTYKSDPMLINIAEESGVKTIAQKVCTGLIISGDSFMNNKEKTDAIKNFFLDAQAIEMEACAIAQVCYVFKVPFVVIRSISDTADHSSHIDFKKFLELAVNNVSELVTEMIKKIKI